MKTRSVGQIAVGQACFKTYNFKKFTVFWVFCCVDFVTSTKTNLEAKIDLSALFWRDTRSQVQNASEVLCIPCIRIRFLVGNYIES